MIHKIKALHNEGAGLSIRSIARELGISRNTVRKYLRMDEAAIGEEQERRTRHKQLDDYRDYIVTLLEQFTNLSAVKVLRKLKERHPELGVSDRSARRYIKAIKETISLRQRRYYEPAESLPGVQCQVDGGELRGVLLGGEATTVHFVVFVLSYSRLMYAGLSPRPIDTATFIRLHDAAFRYFGGRPEECVYDQTGVCQDSCHFFHAANALLSGSSCESSSRAGLSQTTSFLDQSRVMPDQRSGCLALACS